MNQLSQNRLGGSHLTVSPIALGSWRTFERMERADAERLLAYALDSGITFLDDARYNDETGQAPLATGWSEILFGELFRTVGADREGVVVSNKLWWEFWPREQALAEVEGSLERMGFDKLDLLYSSTLPADVSVQVAVEQIAGVLASGRVASWGVVNWSAAELAEAVIAASHAGIAPPCAVQLPYSLARLDWVEDPAMDTALASAGASLIPSAVLAGGALSGKYAAGGSGRLSAELGDSRRAEAFAIGAQLNHLADHLGASPATVAVAFTLLHPRTASTLIGATRPEHIDSALAAIELAQRLGPEQVSQLRALG